MENRVCTKCGEEKPATTEYFYRGGQRLRGDCKVCFSKRDKQYYQENRDAIIERNKQYKQANQNKITKQLEQYRQENRDINAKRQKQYYQKNRDAILEHAKQYRQENQNAILERKAKWRGQNPEKQRAYKQRRKAIKKELPHTLTVEQWEAIKKRFNNGCAYCGCGGELEQEHFVPLSKGGGYTHNNIVPACKSCNNSKYTKSFFEWYPQQVFYSQERYDKILVYIINGGVDLKSGVM